MGYWVGIDVGTTFTAAAVCREEVGRHALPEMVPLGTHSTAVSSVLYLAPDGQVVVGEAAERRAHTHPDRVVREFKRRIGDEVPMVIGGVPHSAPEIAAMVVRWVVDRVTEREGGPAAGIVITHPACWGEYKIQVLADALRASDLPEIMFRTEPEAAAASYALGERVDIGSTIAVYDLGGGTFDAAVVRKTGVTTFSVLGVPQGIEQSGGVDFDDAVFGHVVAAVPSLTEMDPEDPATLDATAALWRECTAAKEALSVDTEVTIPVLAPEVRSQVRLVRAEFEDMIRVRVAETVESLRRALRSADVGSQDLDVVLLVGGSSRVPLVAQLVSAELGRPVAVDADPKASIALGAALSALPADAAPAADPVGNASAPLDALVPQRPSLTAIPLDVEPAQPLWRRIRSQRVRWVAAVGLFVLAAGAVSVLLLTSRSGSATPAPAGSSASAIAPASATPVTTTSVPNTRNGNDMSPGSGGPSEPASPTHAAALHNAIGGAANTAAGVPGLQRTGSALGSGTTSSSNPPFSQAIPVTATSVFPPSTIQATPTSTTVPPTTTTPTTTSSPHRHR